ncbi:MAG: endonuclease 4 [Cenarchaeum symbiont of Oopsacas minuta]|nr:endonuclease 4 [Cenarchaeum symbiont of Oopsacas minuta]
MRIGCHVSISGGIHCAVDNASDRDCTAFQIFTRNPRGWGAKEITDSDVNLFKSKIAKSRIDQSATCAHMPYLPNLSSPKKDVHEKSVATLIDEVKRCSMLGIPYIVTHLGSHLGTGDEAGIKQLVAAYTKAAKVKSDVTILLENTAGQKNSVGSEFEQLGSILSKLKPSKRFGVCIDTCHAFAYGYDLSTSTKFQTSINEFEEKIGVENLKILHLNDAKAPCGSNLDRHEHIGLGQIGLDGMKSAVRYATKHDVPIILETPIDSIRDDRDDLKEAKGLAK